MIRGVLDLTQQLTEQPQFVEDVVVESLVQQ